MQAAKGMLTIMRTLILQTTLIKRNVKNDISDKPQFLKMKIKNFEFKKIEI